MRHYRIVTLDVETGQVVEYGRRSDDDSPPVWVDAVQGVAFFYWNSLRGEAPEIRLGLRDGSIQTIAREVGPPKVQPSTGRLFYFQREPSDNPLRMFDPAQPRAEPRVPWPSIKLPLGRPIIDPTGRSMAILLGTDLPLLNMQNGQVRTYPFPDQPQLPELLPWWAMDGGWSPDGKVLALILGKGNPPENLLRISKLALFDTTSGNIRFIDLPAQFVMELDWDPSSRFILARGVPSGGSMADTNVFWLVDATRGAYKESSYFPATLFPRYPFMAWSRKGQLAWIRGSNNGLQIVITQISPGR